MAKPKDHLIGPAIGYGGKENEPEKIKVRVQVGDALFLAEAIDPFKLQSWITKSEAWANDLKLESQKIVVSSHEDETSFYIRYTGVRMENDREHADRQNRIKAQKFHKLHQYRMNEGFYKSSQGEKEIRELADAFPNHSGILLGDLPKEKKAKKK
jgi:hypothetical protein